MIDPITLEVIRNRLDAIAEEMELTLLRTSHSPIVKEALDASAALFDGGGQQIAQAAAAPIHLGMVIPAVRRIVELFPPETMRDGDVYLLNDPFEGGSHLPDLIMLTPVIVDGETIALSLAVTHHQEIGGRSPGSTPMDATEIYQEGLRIPPCKLYDAGVPNESLLALLAANVRIPENVLGDLAGQIAACRIGHRGLLALVARYGKDQLAAAMATLIDLAERETREAISAIPDSTYRFVDWLDNDGVDLDRRVRIEVAVTVAGSELTVDLTGTDPQVAGPINCVPSSTLAAIYYLVRAVIDPSIPANAGCYRSSTLACPLRSTRAPSSFAASSTRCSARWRRRCRIGFRLHRAAIRS
jgi:N-methylhydantoinase B